MASKTGDLAASLYLMGVIVALAVVGLASDGNWPKIARVGTAFLTYVVVLLAAGGGTRARERLRFPVFGLAGGACGLVSGLVRANVEVPLVISGVLAGAFLLGGVHWLAIRGWGRFRSMATR